MELKHFSSNGTATFINGPANLLNNETKNRPDHLYFRQLGIALCYVVNNNF